MKKFILVLTIIAAIACNNMANNKDGFSKDSSGVSESATEEKTTAAGAGDCSSYYWFKEGMVAEYSSKDESGSEKYHTTSTVKNVRNENGILLADFVTATAKGNNLTATYKCEGDKVYMDMKAFFANNFSGLASKGGMEMEIEDAYLSFPSTMKVGDELEGTKFKITAKKDGKPLMVTTNDIKDRKVLATEKITTPAGSWNCLKISETSVVTSSMMGKELSARETKTIYWFATGVGVIRNDNYDKDGKLTMQTDLISLKK